MTKPVIEISDARAVADQAVEIVERKGVGHPDSICDAALERVSIALSRAYLDAFGTIAHHNIDKGLLIAGSVDMGFGHGRVITPMELIIGDRATYSMNGKKVPVDYIAISEVRAWFAENLPGIAPDRDLKIRVALKPGSTELSGIFDRGTAVMPANDTSAAVGYAPMSPTEQMVLSAERLINSAAFKAAHPYTGTDVKVMGVRTGRELDLTVACPMLATLVKSEADYFGLKDALKAAIEEHLMGLNSAGPVAGAFESITVNLNTLDKPGIGEAGVYLSVLGTSAEDADSGQVGRGNRVNGVIALNRPMGTEAAAGKNPVSHVGKIYSVLAHQMAADMHATIPGVREVYVWLLSRIGAPVDEPRSVFVRVVPEDGADNTQLARALTGAVEASLAGVPGFIERLSRGEFPVC